MGDGLALVTGALGQASMSLHFAVPQSPVPYSDWGTVATGRHANFCHGATVARHSENSLRQVSFFLGFAHAERSRAGLKRKLVLHLWVWYASAGLCARCPALRRGGVAQQIEAIKAYRTRPLNSCDILSGAKKPNSFLCKLAQVRHAYLQICNP